MILADVVDLGEGADDEDDSDEGGEKLLRKPRDEYDQVTPIEDANDHEDQAHPDADPETESQVVKLVLP